MHCMRITETHHSNKYIEQFICHAHSKITKTCVFVYSVIVEIEQNTTTTRDV